MPRSLPPAQLRGWQQAGRRAPRCPALPERAQPRAAGPGSARSARASLTLPRRAHCLLFIALDECSSFRPDFKNKLAFPTKSFIQCTLDEMTVNPKRLVGQSTCFFNHHSSGFLLSFSTGESRCRSEPCLPKQLSHIFKKEY